MSQRRILSVEDQEGGHRIVEITSGANKSGAEAQLTPAGSLR
jgi:hypothetical protein